MAHFVLSTGVQPSEYWGLTRGQREAFYDAIERSQKRRK